MAAKNGRVTLDDVAKAAGVSRMTASYTFGRPDRVAEQTRARVRAAAEQLGFRGPDPSGRLLRTGGLRALGLVLGESLDYLFEDPQAIRFVAGIARECSAVGYGLTIIPTAEKPFTAARITGAAVDGFVVWTTTADDPVLAAIHGTRRRAVVQGGPTLDGVALVGIDDRAAATALALSVWSDVTSPAVLSFPLDRDRVAGLRYGIDPASVPFPVTRNRLAGFKDAAELLGHDWRTIPVAVCAVNQPSDAARAVAALTATGYPVDGLVAMSDQQAVAAHETLGREHAGSQRIVQLGGFVGSDRAAELGITSVHQSLYEQGRRAARIALGLDEPTADATDPWNLTSGPKHSDGEPTPDHASR